MPSEHVTPDPAPDGAPHGGAAAPPAGLPPVAPPSGKLMLQLFLVPGLIVAFLVAAWLVGGWLFGVSYSKKDFLDKLNDPNPEVRWRGAEQMAQVLLRDDSLAQDGDFARQLGLILEKTRDAARPAEEAFAAREPKLTKEEAKAERLKLGPDRNFISYLGAALGNFVVPVGAPVLKDLATRKDAVDPQTHALRRWQAVWALANLGENLKRFDKLDDVHKGAVLERLRVALWDAAQEGGDRDAFLKMTSADKDAALDKLEVTTRPGHADWLRDALRALRSRAAGRDDDMGVGDALVACAGDRDDPFLRQLAALAMSFWRGDDAANRRMDQALLALTNDDGAGHDWLSELADEKEETPMEDWLAALAGRGDQGTTEVSKIPGLQIRFLAATALARVGSKDARTDVLKDMLDENYLRSNLVLRPRDGAPDKPDEDVIGQTLTNALKATAELHRLRPDADLSSLKPAVDALAGSANPDVRTEAEKTKLALSK